MEAEHGWRECRPAVLHLPGANPRDVPVVTQAVSRVWSTLTDQDRAGFHRYCCLGRRDPAAVAVTERMQHAVTQHVHEHRQARNPAHDRSSCCCCCLDCEDLYLPAEPRHRADGAS